MLSLYLPSLPLRTRNFSQTSRILVEPHLVDAEFCNAWMPHYCRSGHPVVSVEQFLDFVPQEPVLDLPRITGQDLFEVAKAKKSTAGGGWPGMRLRLCLLSGSRAWQFCFAYGGRYSSTMCTAGYL